MNARSRRLNGSLGSSWGDAEYSSDEDTSIHSASDGASEVDLEDSDKDVATPLAQRSKHIRPDNSSPSSQPKAKLDNTSTSRITARQSQTLRSSRTTLQNTKRVGTISGAEHQRRSFIMPSMDSSPGGTPLQNAQIRQRSTRQPSSRGSPRASPRFSDRRTANFRQAAQEEPEEENPWYYAYFLYQNIVLPLVAYVLNVFTYGMRHVVKPFLGFALGVGILLFGLNMATGFLRATFTNALMAPVCLIPGSSYIIPACATKYDTPGANFQDLISVQSQFEDILDASKDVTTLPSTIKNSELAIRDLRTLVKYSKLPSRNELDVEFEYFVQTAREASDALSRYNTRIGATMDRVIATNTWTMNVLRGLEDKEASIGSASRVFNAMTGAFIAPPPTLQERIFDQYILHVGKNKDEITLLIEQAQALLGVLNNLDERLSTIFSIATNDDQTITRNQEELLASLWTKLGGNRSDVKANAQSLNLLKNVVAYRKKALAHVSETLLKLQQIQSELENLREGVAAPEILGHHNALPLTYHLDLIEKGVDRLKLARGESMRVEGDHYRNVLRGLDERGGGSGVRELPPPTVTVRAR